MSLFTLYSTNEDDNVFHIWLTLAYWPKSEEDDELVMDTVTSIIESVAEGREIYCYIAAASLHNRACPIDMTSLGGTVPCRPVGVSFFNGWFYSPDYVQKYSPDYLAYVGQHRSALRQIVEEGYFLEGFIALYVTCDEGPTVGLEELARLLERDKRDLTRDQDPVSFPKKERELLDYCDFLITPLHDGGGLRVSTVHEELCAHLQETVALVLGV